jgi:hypothetical protein
VEQNLLWGDEGCVVDQNPLLEKVEQNSIRFGLKGVILTNKILFFAPPRGQKAPLHITS